MISLSQQLGAALRSHHTSLLRPHCCSEPLRRCALCPRCLSNKSFPMPAVSKTLITRLLAQVLLPKKSNQHTWQRLSCKYLNFTNHIRTVTAAQNGHIGCDFNDTEKTQQCVKHKLAFHENMQMLEMFCWACTYLENEQTTKPNYYTRLSYRKHIMFSNHKRTKCKLGSPRAKEACFRILVCINTSKYDL